LLLPCCIVEEVFDRGSWGKDKMLEVGAFANQCSDLVLEETVRDGLMCKTGRGPPYLGEDLLLFELSELRNCSLHVEAGFVCHASHFECLLKSGRASLKFRQ
jgi:hypothetical protein